MNCQSSAVTACGVWFMMAAVAAGNEVPRPEHPRPDFRRDEWLNLNGTWEFRFDPADRGVNDEWFKPDAAGFDRHIVVPFCWESELSGIRDLSGQKIGWYRRTVTVPDKWSGKRAWLRFGAVDWRADVWVNGEKVGQHEGGYTPFEFDITEHAGLGSDATIVVRAFDPTDPHLPTGKQIGWYTPTSGIWQTVWLEARPARYIASLDIRPVSEGDEWSVEVRGRVAGKPGPFDVTIASWEFMADKAVRKHEKTADSFFASFRIDNPKLWSPDSPSLYTLTLELESPELLSDLVHSYFGLRTISRGKYADLPHESVLLNGKPIYLRGALDQSFNPQGIYTAPSDEFMRRDMELTKSLGLNFLRIHIKTEEPRRLYWADKLGVLIMQDMPNTWAHSERARATWEQTMRESLELHRNHPSVIAWCIFNETWGLGTGGDYARQFRESNETQDWVQRMWKLTRELDPTRLVEDNSPDKRDHVVTDLNSWHFYIDDYETARRHIEEVVANTRPGSPFNFVPGRTQGTEPLINSEYGAVSAGGGDRDVSWGFRYLTTQLRRHEKIQGYVYTELSDIEWEHNGFVNYDRSPKDFGYDAFVPDMTVADLQGADFVGFDAPPAIEAEPGQEITVPIFVSHFSDREHAPKLRWWLVATTGFGGRIETKPEVRDVRWERYHVTNQDPLTLRLPDRQAFVGAVVMELLDTDSRRIAANFVNVVVRPHATASPHRAAGTVPDPPSSQSPRVMVVGPKTVCLRFRPDDFCSLNWDAVGDESFASRGKFYAFGAATVEYRIRLPDSVRDAEPEALSLKLELASKSGSERLDWPARRNPLDYPQTDGKKHPSTVRISFDDPATAKLQTLPDDPADARGVLSHLARFHHGGYGFFVTASPGKANAPLYDKLKAGQPLSIKLSVPEGEKAGGLCIYGEKMGRFQQDPQLIILTSKELAKPVGWTSDEPVAVDRVAASLKWLLQTGEQGGFDWRFTTVKPRDGWQAPDFDDSAWQTGKSGFGTAGTPGVHINTTWNTPDIWLRTTVNCPSPADAAALVRFYHDENIEIFVNGKPLLRRTGYVTSYQQHLLTSQERALFREGPNTIAVHCHQTGGGQGVDVGLAWVGNSTH